VLDERSLFATYVRAAILHTLIAQLQSVAPAARASLADWVTDKALESLFMGTMVLRHEGMPQVPWEVGYEFTHDGVTYEWVLAARTGTTGIIRAG
jgi:hypothetical protein